MTANEEPRCKRVALRNGLLEMRRRDREPFWRLRCEVYGGRCSNLLRLPPGPGGRCRASCARWAGVGDCGKRWSEAGPKPLAEFGPLSLTPIQVERHTIPALATGQFDLIEFFRHGHTKLDAVLTQEESAAILAY